MAGLPTLVLVALMTLAGCGSSDEPADSDGPVQTDGSLVNYARTGGVAGIDEGLRVEPDGAATVTIGEPSNTERSFQLADAELDRINSLLEEADFDAMPENPPPTGCADCFVYTVEYGGRTVTYDDASPPPASVGQLVTELDGIVTAHQPKSAGFIKGG